MVKRRLVAAVAVLLVALLAVGLAEGATASKPKKPKPVTITVSMTEYQFTLSKSKVKAGTKVTFVVTNDGTVEHNMVFTTLNKSTRLLEPGDQQKLTITFRKKGRYNYLCAVGRHAVQGMTGTFVVTK